MEADEEFRRRSLLFSTLELHIFLLDIGYNCGILGSNDGERMMFVQIEKEKGIGSYRIVIGSVSLGKLIIFLNALESHAKNFDAAQDIFSLYKKAYDQVTGSTKKDKESA